MVIRVGISGATIWQVLDNRSGFKIDLVYFCVNVVCNYLLSMVIYVYRLVVSILSAKYAYMANLISFIVNKNKNLSTCAFLVCDKSLAM